MEGCLGSAPDHITAFQDSLMKGFTFLGEWSGNWWRGWARGWARVERRGAVEEGRKRELELI